MNVTPITAADLRFSTTTREQAARGLDSLLVTLVTFIRRFVVVTDHQAVALVLWAAHTHAIDAFDCTPYLQITSVMKGSGKTRLLEVLEPIVARPWFTGRTSAAALVRKIDAACPTLLLDETDAAFGGEKEYAEALRGQLNTGYRRSGRSTVCIGQGTNIQARDFRTFSPKALAGISKLPDTVADRCIAIQLRRRTTDEPCERWRERDGHHQAAPFHAQLSAWAALATERLRDARPALPSSLGDRQQDVWEPLIAIADLAGGKWPELASKAAKTLSAVKRVEDEDIKIQLLADTQPLVRSYKTLVPTKVVLAHLHDLDEGPWKEFGKQVKPITSTKVAGLLRGFDIVPTSDGEARGYRVEAFQDAFNRYLPADPASDPSTRQDINNDEPKSPIPPCQRDAPTDGLKSEVSPINTGLADGLTGCSPDTSAERHARAATDDDDYLF